MLEYELKIIGSFALADALDTTQDILVTVPASLYSAEKIDLHDGSFLVRYKAKVNGPAEFTQGAKKQRTKDTTKMSVRLRWAIEAKGRALGVPDLEQYYQTTMQALLTEIKET